MRFNGIMLIAALLALGACGKPADGPQHDASTHNMQRADDPKTPATIVSATPTPLATASTPTTPRSCSAEIGATAAARRVAICRNVSPATHPPCNAVNSCAMIEDEIARSCALFNGDGPEIKGCGPDPRGMEAAAEVVRRYYSAIDARDYATAWTQWGDDGRPGQTLAAFEKGFTHTRTTRVTIGALQPGDGGAGSIYQTVPVTVDATLDDGTRQRFAGTYVVRRVNGVDGATPSQLRWHIDSAKLTPLPASSL
ncbi:hypothetical protein ASG67_17200 [Sphingomonas sp. Leaf339]|nr:hypothetical protein ASG67_17200 [Sphingomonas sp. Leaf339]